MWYSACAYARFSDLRAGGFYHDYTLPTTISCIGHLQTNYIYLDQDMVTQLESSHDTVFCDSQFRRNYCESPQHPILESREIQKGLIKVKTSHEKRIAYTL